MFNLKDFITITLTLFAIIDILGSIPIVVGLRKKMGHIQSEKATIAAGVLMILFLLLGEKVLTLIGIDVSSFALAGAIIIFFLGMEMILGIEFFKGSQNATTGSIVPIAFPLIAGAGTLTTIISLKASYDNLNIFLAIMVNLVIVYLVLKTTHILEGWFGTSGIEILRRVFGIILLSIAIKLAKDNISSWF